MTTVELRCSENPSKLFAKVSGEQIVAGNLIEVACSDCRRRLRKSGESVALVLHRFAPDGVLVDTEIVGGA